MSIVKPIIVNVEKYVDFDMPVVCATLQAPIGMTKEVAKMTIKEVEELVSDSRDSEEVIEYLTKGYGFTILKTYTLTVGKNL